MKPSTKRTLSILLAASLMVGSLFVYTALIKPNYKEMVNLLSKTNTLKETFNTYASLVEEFKNLSSSYQNLSGLQETLSLSLPSKPNLNYALSQVSGIAKLYDLKLKSLDVKELAIRPSKESLAKGLGILRIDLELEGSYENFKSFLMALENNIMIISPVSFKTEKQGANPLLLHRLTVDTYYQSE